MGNGLTADEAAFVEEPLVLTMEFLERIVGQNRRSDLVGNAQYEGVAAPDRSGWRRDQFVVGNAGGKTGLRSAGELLEDGSMRVVSSSRTRSGWSEPDTTVYVPAPDAMIIIPSKKSSN